jgi:hypothetical protein
MASWPPLAMRPCVASRDASVARHSSNLSNLFPTEEKTLPRFFVVASEAEEEKQRRKKKIINGRKTQ